MAVQAKGKAKRKAVSSGEPPLDRTIEALERLAMLSAKLCGASTARVLLKTLGKSQVISAHGAQAEYVSVEWDTAQASFGPADRVIIEDLAAQPRAAEYAKITGPSPTGFFLRQPLVVDDDYSVSLIVTDAAPLQPPSQVDLALLDELAAQMAKEFMQVSDLLLVPEAHVTVALPLNAIIDRCRTSDIAWLILDGGMTVVYANDRIGPILGEPPSLIGKKVTDIATAAIDTLQFLFQHALEQKLSTPAVDLTVAGPLGIRTFSVKASPFSPTTTTDYFLQVAIRDVTQLAARESELETLVDTATADRPAKTEPTAQFLMETLVQRRSLRARNGISYLTLRAWRNPIRSYQITALRSLKAAPPPTFVDNVAAEIEEDLASLIGTRVFKAIVPVPCGHSAEEACFSTAIAAALATRLDLPVIHALGSRKLRGKSHPKTNVTRPPLTLKHPVHEPVLLVDDVATSGRHLEEAAKLLKRSAPAVMPVAWIGGNAAGDDDED